MIRLALVDDYLNLRDALKNFLCLWDDLAVIIEASNGKEFLDRLCISADLPHLVVMDTKMPVMDGFQATRYLSVHYPFIKVLAMSADVDVECRMMECGAAAFLLKGEDSGKIVETIHLLFPEGSFKIG
jgi:DNA-binding NarL/FixJ family response regulator